MIKLADTLAPMSNDFYAVESENVGIDIDGTSKSIQQAYEDGDLSGSGSSIQVDTMPIASVDELGKIYEFIGSTGTYVNGYFYECVSDEQNPPTYSWVQKNVQPNAESGNIIDDEIVSSSKVWSSQKTSSKIAEKVGKTDIATTIDGTSTDTQVPSAKAVWNKSKNKIQRLLDGTDIIVYADSISNEIVTDTVRIMNATNSPYGVDNVNNDFYYTIYNVNDDKYKRILAYDIRKNDMYMIIKHNNIWGTWAKLATMDKIGSTDISDIGDGTVTGAISEVNDSLNQIGNCELIKEVSSSTSYNWNIKDISKYSWLTFSYSSNFITIPYLVFKTVGSCIVKLGSISNNENLKATFTYVSDTNITISASQGSMVRLFGIK